MVKVSCNLFKISQVHTLIQQRRELATIPQLADVPRRCTVGWWARRFAIEMEIVTG